MNGSKPNRNRNIKNTNKHSSKSTVNHLRMSTKTQYNEMEEVKVIQAILLSNSLYLKFTKI